MQLNTDAELTQIKYGLTQSTQEELLADYIKSVDLLTIENDRFKLERQVKELNEKSKDNEYLIKGKLSEKDREIAGLKEQAYCTIKKRNAVHAADTKFNCCS